MRTYFKTQRDLASGLKEAIDKYWNLEIEEKEFIEYIIEVANKNEKRLYKDKDYTGIIKQRLGIYRLELLDKILKKDWLNDRRDGLIRSIYF